MRLPAPLLRRKKNVHKYSYGHVLILAGSPSMLGAAALTALATMRSGAGLVTLGIPKSLNTTAQKKISPIVMTLPLPESREGTLSLKAFTSIKDFSKRVNAIALGPGLSREKRTLELIVKIISSMEIPMVIDADGLFAISQNPSVLLKTKTPKILTPHTGEMCRLANVPKKEILANRREVAEQFIHRYPCTLILKGPNTLVISPRHRPYINHTGNSGMATAGSGDVLTGMVTAFLAQGLEPFEAAKWAVYLHGLAGDIAAKKKTRLSLVATDIIECIPFALRQTQEPSK